MALPSSGTITLNQISTEFSEQPPYKLGTSRGKGGTNSSGILHFSDFYGVSATPLPTTKDVAAGYVRSVHAAQYSDDGSTLFNTAVNTHRNIVYYYYNYGQSVSFSPNIESNKLNITDATLDIYTNHFTLSGDRADFKIKFFNASDIYLGYFKYGKTSSTWSTADYTDIEFYNASNIKILDIPANNFSGTSYGNGRFFQTMVLNNSSSILFKCSPTPLTSHETSVNHSFAVSHPFASATKISLTITKLLSTYSTGSTDIKVSDGYELLGVR